MRNLKKVLSTLLAVAMLMGFIGLSASATSFSDDKDIAHKEAVDMATALNIINGYADGTYRPAGNITRGEMAKMICFVMNGGNEPTLGVNTTATFADIKGHWAEKYIEYCVAEKIVAGYGDGTFGPEGNITGTQAAKMLLVALGYRADVEGFNTSSWATKINVRATQKKLFDEVTAPNTDPNVALTRDNAAQMIWNALQAGVVEYTYELVMVDGVLTSVLTAKDVLIASTNDPLTLLAQKYNQDDFVGTFINYSWNDKDKVFVYTVDSDLAAADKGEKTFKSTKDYSQFFGMEVKAIYRTKNSDNTLFGMIANKGSVMASGLIGDIAYDKLTDTSFTIGDKNFVVDSAKKTVGGLEVQAMKNYKTSNLDNFSGLVTAQTNSKDTTVELAFAMNVLDTNGDGKADTITYIPIVGAKVDSLTSKNVTLKDAQYLDNNGVANAVNTFRFGLASNTLVLASNNVYEGIAEKDYVAVVPAGYNPYDGNQVVKMEKVSGKVDGQKGTDNKQVRVDGTWYERILFNTERADADLDSTYDFATVGSYIFFSDLSEGASMKDVAYVADIKTLGVNYEAKLYFTDGTNNTVKVTKVQYKDSTGAIKDMTGVESNANHKLFTFKKKTDNYELMAVNAKNLVGQKSFVDNTTGTFAGNASVLAKSNSKPGVLKFNTQEISIATDAFVFLGYDNDKAVVLTGAKAKALTSTFTGQAGSIGQAVTDSTTAGSGNAKLAVVFSNGTQKPGGTGVGAYGYITKFMITTATDGTTVSQMTIWNGTKLLEDVQSEDFTSGVQVGDVINYIDLGNGKIEADTSIVGNGIVRWDGTADVVNNADILKPLRVAIENENDPTLTVTNGGTATGTTPRNIYITKDTVIMNVDTAADTYATSKTLREAKTEQAVFNNGSGVYLVPNALVLCEANGGNYDVVLVVIDNNYNYEQPNISNTVNSSNAAMGAVTAGTNVINVVPGVTPTVNVLNPTNEAFFTVKTADPVAKITGATAATGGAVVTPVSGEGTNTATYKVTSATLQTVAVAVATKALDNSVGGGTVNVVFKSNVATLSGITVNAAAATATGNAYTYSIAASAVATAPIVITATDTNATISVTGAATGDGTGAVILAAPAGINATAGNTVNYTITVTAQNGATVATYTLAVTTTP